MIGKFICQKCGNPLLKEYEGGKRKLRTNILVWQNDKCTAKCPKCKTDVSVTITLNMPQKVKKIHYVVAKPIKSNAK